MVTAFSAHVIKIDGSKPPSSKTRLLDFPLYLDDISFVLSFFFFLVYMVVMQLKDNLIPGEFLMAIRYRPVALSLHIKVSLWEKSCVNEGVFVQGSNQEKICRKVVQRNSFSVWQLILYLLGNVFLSCVQSLRS